MKKRWSSMGMLTLALIALAIVGCTTTASTSKPISLEELVAEAEKEVRQVTPAESKAILDKGDAIFLDCREAKEFKMGHIPGAMHICRGLMEWKIDKKIPNKDAKIVMYCKSGGRSNISAHSIQRLGYTNVVHLHGGWLAWQKAGYPVD